MGITAPIDITPSQRKIVVSLLTRHLPGITVWAFGSRVKWTSRPDSDLDLVAFSTPEKQRRISALKEAFEESSLPFRIDLMVWDEIPDNFRPNILSNHVVLLEADEGKIETRGGCKWRSSTWGDEISLEYGKALRGYEISQGKYRVFGSNGPIGWTDKPLANGPGVILGRKGAYRGVQYSESDFFVIDTAYYVVPKTDLDMRWLYYAIQFHKLGEIDDGSPIPSTTRAAVYVRDLEVPPKTIQREIARILGSIDDKIELNRQINQTLEQMAQAIFKSWFVDFEPVKAKIKAKSEGRDPERAAMCAISGKTNAELDQLPFKQRQELAATAALFPDELVESDLGLIPKGWEVSTLKELTVKIGSGATPRGGSGVYLDEGTALIRSQNVYDSEFVWDGLARISDSAAKQLSSVEVKREDVLLNITGASILRTCVVVPEVLPARVNQHVAIIRSKPGIPARYLHLHLLQQSTKDYLMGLNAGASREAVTKGHIESVPALYPHPEMLACFGAVTDSIYSEVEQLASQTRTLANLRDTLLPKLFSGELPAEEH